MLCAGRGRSVMIGLHFTLPLSLIGGPVTICFRVRVTRHVNIDKDIVVDMQPSDPVMHTAYYFTYFETLWELWISGSYMESVDHIWDQWIRYGTSGEI